MKTNLVYLLPLLFLTSCGALSKTNSFKELTVEAGKNQFKPANHAIYLNTPDKSYQVWFDSSAAIVHPLDTENDWNKGEGGISWSLFTHHKNSVMWAWRWSIAFQHFEMTWYAHIDGVRKFGEPMAAVQPGETFVINIKEARKGVWRIEFETDPLNWSNYVNQSRVIYAAQPFITFHDIQIGKSRGISKNIPAWWGGTYPAPRKVKMFVRRNLKCCKLAKHETILC